MPKSPRFRSKTRWIYSIFLSGVTALLLLPGCTPPLILQTPRMTTTSAPTQTSTSTLPPTLTLPPEPTSTTVVRDLYANIPTITDDSLTKEQIAEQLITRWLEQFKNETVNSDQRLIEFQKISAEIGPDLQKCAKDYGAEYIATMTYSVQPLGTPSDWYAGSGNVSDDFKWIIRQDYIAVIKNGDSYSWKPLGIPVCPTS